jgi:hypothetical protein
MWFSGNLADLIVDLSMAVFDDGPTFRQFVRTGRDGTLAFARDVSMAIPTRWAAFVAVAMGLFDGATRQAPADPITYTESFTATGTLGGGAFSGLLTITGTADTSNVTQRASEYTVLTAATLTIGGGSAIRITDAITAIDNQGGELAGFRDTTTSQFLYNENSAFATYDLKSSIGPSSGTVFYSPDRVFSTSAGDLVITGGEDTATFTAVLSPASVPEPSSLVMCGIAGVAGLVVARVRRKRGA